LSQFPSYSSCEAQAAVPNPCASESFICSKLDLSQRETHAQIYAFHQDVLRLRRDDAVIARQDRWQLDGAILSPDTLVVRFFTHSQDEERLLIVNLGADLDYRPAPEPLLAPPSHRYWYLCWSSDDPRYGGPGIINPCDANGWHIPGASATFFVAQVLSNSER
jgi:maltooligosyltrehalose trehalohydrolase